ncbi:uncharacterized protein LOC106013976, partial [Aplysia californica]|uniref:Uncharacterized protein LOC106013976 n=1 Tax=Aplysia californica TaxID=6500 RepID=A0ABM1AEY9_APLCA
MVHYDRDPLYWQGREKPAAAEQNSDFDSQLRLMAEYGKGLVPENVQPASTPSSVSSAHQSQIGSFQYDTGDIARGGAKDGVATVTLGSREKSGGNSGVNIEHNKHRLWSPGSEAAGFKPYTPFSDSLFDFGKKEAKYIPPEVEVVKEVLAVPRYYDAYRDVLGLSSRDQNGGPDILRIHGTPEYPKK